MRLSLLAEKLIEVYTTLFFLSKLGFTGNNIRFVLDTAKKWDGIDVLVTANPVALQAKPEGKISVKVSASYNQDVEADYTIETIMELFDNEELLKQITTV
jgi:glycine cleavage system regulatory protein